MVTSRPPVPLAALTLLLALAGLVDAATIRVPKDHETIQAAIDAAGPDDVVAISSGVYTENLTIPEGKNGLTLQAKGTVILDAYTDGNGVAVQSNGVALRGLIIRHAAGYAVDGNDAADLVLDRVTVVRAQGGLGVFAGGPRTRITNCLFRGNQHTLELTGPDAVVERTTILGFESYGVRVLADGATVVQNHIQNGYSSEGIFVVGDDALVDRNVVSATGQGIEVNGQDAIVTRNTVEATCFDSGLVVNGDDAQILRNRVMGVGGGYDGVGVNGSDGLVERNIVERISGIGLYCSGDNNRLVRNQVRDAGADDDYGMSSSGQANILERNRVSDCAGEGIVVFGDDTRLVGNDVRDNMFHGVWVVNGVDGTVIEQNRIQSNLGDGVKNEGTNTTLTKNKILKNRVDITNATGLGATLFIDDKTKFGSGGAETEPDL